MRRESSETEAQPTISLPGVRRAELRTALWLSTEHEYFEISMDLRRVGVCWNLHSWTQALLQADRINTPEALRFLMDDLSGNLHEDFSPEFVDLGLSAIFRIFKDHPDAEVRGRTASVISKLWGRYTLPAIQVFFFFFGGGEVF